MRFGFSKAHQKITPRGKSGRGHGLGYLPNILEFPFNIFATAEDNNFKFGVQFGFSIVRHKITPRGKSGRGPGLGEIHKIWGSPLIFLQRLKIATSKLAGWWGLPRPIKKSNPEEKVGLVMG